MSKRSHLRDMPVERSGYYGLRRWLVILSEEERIPAAVHRVYWWFQPLRCVLGWHDWYSQAAGQASACRCGASEAYPKHLMHKYRWDKHARLLASRLEEEEYRAQVFIEAYLEALAENAAGWEQTNKDVDNTA